MAQMPRLVLISLLAPIAVAGEATRVAARDVLRLRLELPAVTIELAHLERDAPPIHSLLGLVYEGTDDIPAAFDEWLSWWLQDDDWDPAGWFAARADGELAGVALCWKTGFVKDLAVHPAYRRRGIGRALLLHVIEEYRRRAVSTIELKVDARNDAALALYESLGMRIAK
jgi:ribosomal protein S18 acetylase RimI-like enzyme